MSNLSDDARKECLFLARRTLHAHIRGQSHGTAFTPTQPELLEPRGAFVTLKAGGQLRGCIGHILASRPLWQTIEQCTMASATEDPRFPPVQPDELPDIEIEISVLSPLEPVTDVESIEVGRHGLLISRGFSRGLLLPQVAPEYGWNREEFLAHTCRKAGLPPDAWRSGARIERFTAEVFAEKDYNLG